MSGGVVRLCAWNDRVHAMRCGHVLERGGSYFVILLLQLQGGLLLIGRAIEVLGLQGQLVFGDRQEFMSRLSWRICV